MGDGSGDGGSVGGTLERAAVCGLPLQEGEHGPVGVRTALRRVALDQRAHEEVALDPTGARASVREREGLRSSLSCVISREAEGRVEVRAREGVHRVALGPLDATFTKRNGVERDGDGTRALRDAAVHVFNHRLELHRVGCAAVGLLLGRDRAGRHVCFCVLAHVCSPVSCVLCSGCLCRRFDGHCPLLGHYNRLAEIEGLRPTPTPHHPTPAPPRLGCGAGEGRWVRCRGSTVTVLC